MKIALVQTDLVWENPPENRRIIRQKIASISQEVDLIILPEMFATGFTMNAKNVAETMQGETVNWMKTMANKYHCAVVGSLIIEEDNQYYNRLIFAFANNTLAVYNKRHLFSLAKEEEVYTAGNEKNIIEYKGWKICPLICYDLRFPAFSRNQENYDLLLYVASWPQVRMQAWNTLLPARAIENMVYTIGVNRVGIDGNNHPYVGHSRAIDYLGNDIISPSEKDEIIVISLDKDKQNIARERFGFLKDQDDFILK